MTTHKAVAAALAGGPFQAPPKEIPTMTTYDLREVMIEGLLKLPEGFRLPGMNNIDTLRPDTLRQMRTAKTVFEELAIPLRAAGFPVDGTVGSLMDWGRLNQEELHFIARCVSDDDMMPPEVVVYALEAIRDSLCPGFLF